MGLASVFALRATTRQAARNYTTIVFFTLCVLCDLCGEKSFFLSPALADITLRSLRALRLKKVYIHRRDRKVFEKLGKWEVVNY
jgi:hypothetical protein